MGRKLSPDKEVGSLTNALAYAFYINRPRRSSAAMLGIADFLDVIGQDFGDDEHQPRIRPVPTRSGMRTEEDLPTALRELADLLGDWAAIIAHEED